MTDKTKSTKRVTKSAATSQAKVFDIAHPGQTLPNSSGKPIIVSHRSLVRDPMVTADGEAETTDEPATAPVLSSLKKTRIEPLHNVSADEPATDDQELSVNEVSEPLVPLPEKLEPEAKPEEAVAPADEEAEEDPVPVEPAEDEAKTEAEPAAVEETDETDDEIAQLDAQAKERSKKEAEAEAETKRQAELDALIMSKQYHVPINAVKKRRSAQAVLLLVIVVVVAIGFLAALDAGLIDTGLTAPTDFIPN